MKTRLLSLLFFFVYAVSFAQQIKLSDSTQVSLITCSPSSEVYTRFGHTAIRINDPISHIDVIFNYGMFSFNSSNFIFKFIKGETDYQLGYTETSLFLPEYQERNSSVWEQKLNMTVAERQKLIELLLENYKPENRVYRYNFVYDNCATRPRDKIISSLDGYLRFEDNQDKQTFRQLIGKYTGSRTWLKFGIDILLGMDADQEVTNSESMFLPEMLMNGMESGEIQKAGIASRKIVREKVTLINGSPSTNGDEKCNFLSPIPVSIFLLIIGIAITAWDFKRKRHLKIFDSMLYVVTGLAGVIIAFLMLFSTHPLIKDNLNILWLNPLNIVLASIIWIKNLRLRKIAYYYQILNMLLLIGALINFAVSVQTMNHAFFPLIVLLLIRSSHWFAHSERIIRKLNEKKR